MELYLSSSSPTRTILSTGSPGASNNTPLYHISTPHSLMHKMTTILRISPNLAHDPSAKALSNHLLDAKEYKQYGAGVQEVAQIHWKTFGSPTLSFGSQTVKGDDFLSNGGPLRP